MMSEDAVSRLRPSRTGPGSLKPRLCFPHSSAGTELLVG